MQDPGYGLRRIYLLGTSVNRVWTLLRASPLHGVDHLLGRWRKLIEIASRTNKAYGYRPTLHILED
jgi:hypothetical protein